MSDQSGRNFDAEKEAAKITTLAKDRLDTSDHFFGGATKDGLEAAKKLTEEWTSLTYDERLLTADAIQKKYENHKSDAMPVPYFLTDNAGKFNGIGFEASSLDFHLGPYKIKLVEGHGTVTEFRGGARYTVVIRDNDPAEYVCFDTKGRTALPSKEEVEEEK